jgi:phage terminase small subunit
MSDKELTAKHKAFCNEYLTNGFNGTHAAIKAGYTESCATSTASEILTYPNVKEYIRITLDSVVGTMKDVLEKRIIETYYKRAFYDIAQFMNSDGEINIDDINEAGFGCIIDGVKKAKTVTTGENFDKVESAVYELADRDKALAQLTKYMNLINEKIDLDITTKVILTTQDAGLL